MPFVQRDSSNKVMGVYANPQPGYAEEELSDDHPDVVAYHNPPLTEADFQSAIEAHIEATAKARQYSSAVSCASYAQSNIPAWQAEALAFIGWRDQVWAYAFTELAKVQNEEREPPASIAAFIAELPAMTWPS